MIITITPNPSIDISIDLDSFCISKVNRTSNTHQDAGGKGINVSKVLNVLGSKSVAMGFVGRENYNIYNYLLAETGLRPDFVFTDGCIRTNIKINDGFSHTTTEINGLGRTISADELNEFKARLAEYLDNKTIAVISGSGNPPQIYSELTDFCIESGARVIVDTSGEGLRCACEFKPYIIKPNIDELSELTGQSLRNLEKRARAAIDLVDNGIHAVMVSMGSDGLMLVNKQSVLYSPGIKVNAICTVGAGDAVTAALAHALENDLDDETTLRLAAAAGTAAVATRGSMPPSSDMVQYFYDKVEIKKINKLGTV